MNTVTRLSILLCLFWCVALVPLACRFSTAPAGQHFDQGGALVALAVTV